jgi:pimeloyl-ACP methyl ester carboxylesterase
MRHSVNGVRLNVLDEGEGPPILFLHGLGGCWRDWEPQLDGLRDRYRCVVVEHRGHGRSEATTGEYSIELFADDVIALAHRLGIERAHVVGLSMGGMIAQRVALAAPSLVDTLVLCDTVARFPEEAVDGLIALARAARADGFPDSRGVVPTEDPAWSAHALVHLPEVVRSNKRESEATDPDVWCRAAYAIAAHDTVDRLGEITVPVLLLWGEEDGIVPFRVGAPLLEEGLADTEVITLPDGGHLCNLDQPHVFNEVITGFFARRGGL